MRDIVSPLSGFGSPFGQRRRTFTPAVLFAASEPGVWLDPSDPAALFSDTAGTTQAGIGDPVALVLDKSGNGNHATQPTLASRPILREADGLRYLEFDGVDDFLVTPTTTPGTDQVQMFAGARAVSLSAAASVFEHGSREGGTARIQAPGGNAGRYTFGSVGASSGRFASSQLFTAPHSAVLTGLGDTDAPFSTLRVNGDLEATDTFDQGQIDYIAAIGHIGSRSNNTLFFNGNIYSIITRFGPNLDDPTTERTERYVAKRTGVSL